MNPKEWVVCTISKVIRETPDTVTLRIQLPENDNISFIPGQYIMFGFLNGEESNRTKFFSISSAPISKDGIDITVKSEGAFSTRMTKMKEGEKIKIRGPIGHFVFKDDYKKDLIMIAGGTGLAPIMSMIRYIVNRRLPNKIKLLYSVRSPEHILYKQELRKINELENITTTLTMTRLQETDKWDGNVGRIEKKVIEDQIEDFKNSLFFICGPDKMIDDIIKILREMGAGIGQIKVEKWGIGG